MWNNNYSVFKPKSSPNFSVEFTNCEGIIKRISLRVKDKRQAQIKAPQVIEQHNTDLQTGKNKKSLKVVRLSRLMEETFRDKWASHKDTKSVLQRSADLVKLMNDPIVTEITEKDILEMVEKLREKGFKNSTFNRYLACLKTALRQAYRIYKYIDRMPTIDSYKEPKGRVRFMSREEEVKILEAASKPIIRDLVVVLVDTGMRLSECLKLEAVDCNLLTEVITVWIQKGDEPRSIPMTDRVREALERVTEQGRKAPFKHITAYAAQHYWKAIRKNINKPWIKELSYHSLRHTCASRLVEAEVSLYVVKEILGHADI